MKKFLFAGIVLGGTVNLAWADSDAISFAIQAGAIAGAAQACGQDPALLGSRVAEALMLLAKDDDDRTQASSSYQRALQEANRNEAATQKIGCNQVLQDYNSLPILKSDYKQTVLAPLLAGPAGNTTNPGAVSSSNPAVNQAAAPAAAPSSVLPATNSNDALTLPSQQQQNVTNSAALPQQNTIQNYVQPTLPDMSHSGGGTAAPALPGNYVPEANPNSSQQSLVLQNNPAYQQAPANNNPQIPVNVPSTSSGGPAY